MKNRRSRHIEENALKTLAILYNDENVLGSSKILYILFPSLLILMELKVLSQSLLDLLFSLFVNFVWCLSGDNPHDSSFLLEVVDNLK